MKKWGIILGCVFLFIIAPFMINLAFKIEAPVWWMKAEWDAEHLLGFYGSILAGAMTILGVYYTILHTQKNYREDIHNRVLPYFALTALKIHPEILIYKYFNRKIEKEKFKENAPLYYSERKVNEVLFSISDGLVKTQAFIPKDIKTKIENLGINEDGTISGLLNIPLEIENVGNGTAINFRIGFYKNSTKRNEQLFLMPTNLRVGDTFKIHIFSDSLKADLDCAKYSLELIYQDIFQQAYKQIYAFEIYEKEGELKAILNAEGIQKKTIYVE